MHSHFSFPPSEQSFTAIFSNVVTTSTLISIHVTAGIRISEHDVLGRLLLSSLLRGGLMLYSHILLEPLS